MIRAMEELSINAWPSLQTVILDGWVLRFAEGYTRRANSVHPLYPGTVPLDQKVQAAEAFYHQKKQKVIFKLTAAAEPSNLDEILAARGYRHDAPTSVHTLDLRKPMEQPAVTIDLRLDLSEEWLGAFSCMSELDNTRERQLAAILGNIVPTRCFASVVSDGRIVACGLAVMEAKHIGLFDVVTDKDVRGRGYGKLLLLNLLGWGKQQGAETAYLQVMFNNPAALALYAKMGFAEVYQYWYRVLDA